MNTIKYVSPCLLGVEGIVADELRHMGADDVEAVNGKVMFSGDEHILARANICSRYSERIQILIGTFDADNFDVLFDEVKSLPWEDWIGKLDAFPVKGWSLNSKLKSVPDCQSIIKKAIVERLKSKYNIDWFEETGPVHQIQFSIMNDKACLMIDTSGEGLHKRGYRPASNIAPIKETLAASMAYLARLRHFHTLYDPFCGSGTILIEGTMLAHNIAPGLRRNFAAERWDIIHEDIWRQERERARDLIIKQTEFAAYGSDIDEKSLELTEINAKRAGVASKIKLSKTDIKDFEPKSEKGTVICNPPYGERMLDVRQSEELYGIMGRVFEKRNGWSYYIISPHEQFEHIFGRKADKRRKLYNGMIKCQLYMYFK